MADDTKLLVSIEASTKQFENALKRIERATNAAFKGGQANVTKLDRSMSQAAASAGKLEKSLATATSGAAKFQQSLLAPLSGIAAALSVQSIVKYADAWTQAGNKIAAASIVAGKQARSLEDINKIATETRSSLTSTVDLYSKLLIATKDVAESEEDVARATEIVNKAFKAGGAAAETQAAGIQQLAQGLGSGVLAGDELKSVKENATLLAEAIAREFGTTIEGLKALGEAGELTAGRVFKGILRAEKDIETAFAATQSTVGDAITNIENAFTQLVGVFDKATGASQKVVEALNGISKAIDAISNRDIRGFMEAQGAAPWEIAAVTGLIDAVKGAIPTVAELNDAVQALLHTMSTSPEMKRLFSEDQKQELLRIQLLLEKDTPEAAREAVDALHKLAAENYRFDSIAQKGQVLIDYLADVEIKAQEAKQTIDALSRTHFSASDLARAAGTRAKETQDFFTAEETKAAQDEFQNAVQRKADELVKAADKLGIALDRAAAEVEAARLVRIEESTRALGSAISDFTNDVVQAEAPQGGPNLAGASSAFGVGQFIESTWLDLFKKHFPDRAESMTNAAILALRADAAISKALIEDYARENAAVLQKAGVTVTAAALQLAHFLGAGDAAKVLNAAPGTPLQGLISSKSIAANPTILGGGKTVDDAIRYAQNRVGGSRSVAAQEMEKEAAAVKKLTELKAEFEETLRREGEAIEFEISQIGKSTAAQEYAATKQELTNQLIAAGIPITKEYAAAIEEIAQASAARVTAQEIFNTNEEQNQDAMAETVARADEIRNLASDVLGGLASDLANGVKPAEALANALGKIAQKLIDIGTNAIVSGLFGPQGTPLGGLFGGAFGGGTVPLITGGLFAQGGVMTSHGPMPLKRYGSGGVAVGPQMALFGEGSTPEAYVPLPDGRSIPVRIKMPSLTERGSGAQQKVAIELTTKAEPSPLLLQSMDIRARQAEDNAVLRAPGHMANMRARRLVGESRSETRRG